MNASRPAPTAPTTPTSPPTPTSPTAPTARPAPKAHYRAPVQALCLAGPTASGKSALAMGLARRWPIEIISVDSALVYRGMDIGTAKPSAAERAEVPHHLIDILDPQHPYSAARFAADAQNLVAAITARGRLPLLVGGTMLYFKALRQGLSKLPVADPDVRADISRQAHELGWPALHAQLMQVDPSTAARLAPLDGQRIQRALEVWRSSGRSLSDWHQSDPEAPDAAAQADRLWPLLALEPTNRAWLHARIEQRLQQMHAAGLEHEVQRLRARADLSPAMPSMRCVGYRQVWAALDAVQNQSMPSKNPKGGGAYNASAKPAGATKASVLAQPIWHETALAATRQLAKHQLTWLRSVPGRTVLACDAPHLEPLAHQWFESHLQI